jgi:hypothetical protein
LAKEENRQSRSIEKWKDWEGKMEMKMRQAA